jgi:hypothetical protein
MNYNKNINIYNTNDNIFNIHTINYNKNSNIYNINNASSFPKRHVALGLP